MRKPTENGLIPPHGGYKNLKSYQNAEIIHDATVEFCDRYVNRYSRTVDQMVQAARSGKQNIAEESMASGTSKKTELKLVSVARASLEELCSTTKISFVSTLTRFGRRTTRRPNGQGIGRTASIGPMPTPIVWALFTQPRSLPI